MTSPSIPRIQFARTDDDVRIAYTEMGEGPTLLYVPGWISHIELERADDASGAFNERLARSHHLVMYDGRGTGLSQRDVEDLSIEARLKDLEAVVRQAHLDRFSIFSWSENSPVALTYAARNTGRVEKLILFAAFCEGLGSKPTQVPLLRALLDLIRAEWGVGIRTTMGFIHPDADQQEADQALNYLRAASSGEVAASILEQGFFHTQVCDQLPNVQAQTLVLHRREDHAIPIDFGRQVASLIPNARFMPLDGDHHLPFHGDPDAVLSAIEEFLGVESGPAIGRTPLAPAAAPVTMLFTDLEGSTTLTERLGDARAQELLREHDRIVRRALSRCGGSEIKHTGDGIMASFVAASRALECAADIQRDLAQRNEAEPDTPIRVRIGLNVGEPVRERDDLFGTAVQLARRICDRAEPEQILVSNVVRELVAGKGFLFADMGESALRGFEDPVRLYQVRWRE